MGCFCVRLLVAVISFGLGLSAHTARRSFERSLYSDPEIEQLKLPSETFVGTGTIDMFMEDYLRESDNAIVRFGCSQRSSAAAALALVRHGSSTIQRTDILDVNGQKIGERVVSGGPNTQATITWNEGSRLFYIEAPSVADGISFENSKVWVGGGCWDFSLFDSHIAAE